MNVEIVVGHGGRGHGGPIRSDPAQACFTSF